MSKIKFLLVKFGVKRKVDNLLLVVNAKLRSVQQTFDYSVSTGALSI